jgi:hypothetical protein
MSQDALTLEMVVEFLKTRRTDDAQIFDYLTLPIDEARVGKLIAQIEEINTRPRPRGVTARAWEGTINAEKGHVFEEIGGILLSSIRCFKSHNRVATTMNEIDWLVEMGPTADWLQSTREWGTHVICECKCGSQKVTGDWVTKLGGVMESSQARVGFLISSKGLGKTGGSIKIRFKLQLLAAVDPKRFILCMNTEEVRQSVADGKFLRLLCQRYIETKSGVARVLSMT